MTGFRGEFGQAWREMADDDREMLRAHSLGWWAACLVRAMIFSLSIVGATLLIVALAEGVLA